MDTSLKILNMKTNSIILGANQSYGLLPVQQQLKQLLVNCCSSISNTVTRKKLAREHFYIIEIFQNDFL